MNPNYKISWRHNRMLNYAAKKEISLKAATRKLMQYSTAAAAKKELDQTCDYIYHSTQKPAVLQPAST